jgi:DNA-binding CsgD family transcriptional regulator
MNQAFEFFFHVEENNLLNQHACNFFGEVQFQQYIKNYIDHCLKGNLVNGSCLLKDHTEIKKTINLEFIPFSKESDAQGLIILFRIRNRAQNNKTLSNGSSEWEKRKKYIDHQLQTHYKDFIRRLKTQYPHLTIKDLIHCCLIRMNLSTEEAARYFNVNPTSVQKRRVRLKKKLSLSREDDLITFLFSQ